MAELAMAAMISGGILQGSSALEQGQLASRSATSAANQLDQNAKAYDVAANQTEASSQRKASEIKRQNRLLQSRIIALNAASGGSSSEKNISDLLTNTEAEGEYNALSALYEGSSRANQLRNEGIGLRNKAVATRAEGKAARKAGTTTAISGLLNSAANAGTFYAKYGNPSPTATSVNFDDAKWVSNDNNVDFSKFDF